MARSSYIYVLVTTYRGETLGAFTVKHEMEAVRAKQLVPTYYIRYRDGKLDSGTVVD